MSTDKSRDIEVEVEISDYEKLQKCNLRNCELLTEERQTCIERNILEMEDRRRMMDIQEEEREHSSLAKKQDKIRWERDRVWFESSVEHNEIYKDHVDQVNRTNEERLKIEASKAKSWERIANALERMAPIVIQETNGESNDRDQS